MSDTNVIVKQFKKLVSTSLKNESINQHIKRKRLLEFEVFEDDLVIENFEDCEDYDFLENSVRVMNFDMVVKNDLLYEVLASWHQLQRNIIYLSLCENWSDQKIGSRLNMSRSTVQRIKKKLQDELRQKLNGGCDE